MLILRGAPVLSDFRLDKLAQKLALIHPDIQLLHTEYVHFADLQSDLSVAQREVLESLLEYGPGFAGGNAADLDSAALRLVVPRPGTISPWSSKATDIAHNCGLAPVLRLERGVAWYFRLPILSDAQHAAVDELVHDRMTEAVFDSLEQPGELFQHAEPAPLGEVDVLGGGRQIRGRLRECRNSAKMLRLLRAIQASASQSDRGDLPPVRSRSQPLDSGGGHHRLNNF